MQLFLSQLIRLISATWETKEIMAKVIYPAQDWDAIFDFKGVPTEAGTHVIKNCQVALTWANKVNTGQRDQGLMLSFDEIEVKYAGERRYLVPSGFVFDFTGSHCNDRTRFLYYMMGNRVHVRDDIGVLGGGTGIEQRSICQLSASEHFRMQMRGEAL